MHSEIRSSDVRPSNGGSGSHFAVTLAWGFARKGCGISEQADTAIIEQARIRFFSTDRVPSIVEFDIGGPDLGECGLGLLGGDGHRVQAFDPGFDLLVEDVSLLRLFGITGPVPPDNLKTVVSVDSPCGWRTGRFLPDHAPWDGPVL